MDPKDFASALYGKPKDPPKPPDPATGNAADRGTLMNEFKNALYPRHETIRDALKHVQAANLARLADRYNWPKEEIERVSAATIEAFTKLNVPPSKAADLHTRMTELALREFTPEQSVALGEDANRRLRQRYGDDEALRVKTKFAEYEKSNPELSGLLVTDGLRNDPQIIELVASAIRRDEGRES